MNSRIYVDVHVDDPVDITSEYVDRRGPGGEFAWVKIAGVRHFLSFAALDKLRSECAALVLAWEAENATRQ